jgi:hypothetical protein
LGFFLGALAFDQFHQPSSVKPKIRFFLQAQPSISFISLRLRSRKKSGFSYNNSFHHQPSSAAFISTFGAKV